MPQDNKALFFNRELSWLRFDRRVLELTRSSAPLFERLRFLSIAASNLDEFFMIRVSSVRADKAKAPDRPDASGMTPSRQLAAIASDAAELYAALGQAYDELRSRLAALGTRLWGRYSELDDDQRDFCEGYFEAMLPGLEPVMLGSAKSLPLFPGRRLYIGAVLKWRSGDIRFAAVALPEAAERLIRLPCPSGAAFIPVEEIILEHIGRLFPGHEVISCGAWRILRDADLALDEDEPGDLAEAVRRSLPSRERGAVLRIEADSRLDKRFVRLLGRGLSVPERMIMRADAPIDLTFLERELYGAPEGNGRRYAPYEPILPERLANGGSMLDELKRGDILLEHPFDSFEPVERFLREAAEDERVTAVRITLYRVSDESPIIAALEQAARAGKQVTVFIEARARFDEEHNLACGKALEKAGVNVIYGLPGLKTHSKIALVTRREADGLHKYTQLGTGNYNDVTARSYTDYSLFTADMATGGDALEFFRCLTGSLERPDTERLVVAPFELRERFRREIKRERAKGADGFIMARMNSLTDRRIIKWLYKASRAGVRIRLLVRGTCCLVPGVPGMSETIEVCSVVGRFLEHSRAYIFGEGDERRVYLSSADWMTRNLDYRVEVMFPVSDRELADRVASELTECFADAPGTYRLAADGSYTDTGVPGGLSVQRRIMLERKKRRKGK